MNRDIWLTNTFQIKKIVGYSKAIVFDKIRE